MMRSTPAGQWACAFQLRSEGATANSPSFEKSGLQNMASVPSRRQTVPARLASSTQGSGKTFGAFPRVVPTSPTRVRSVTSSPSALATGTARPWSASGALSWGPSSLMVAPAGLIRVTC